MAALRLYHEEIRYLSSSEVIKQRREILRTINGNAFLPLKKVARGNETDVLEEANWGPANLQTFAALHWKWLFSHLDLSLDLVVPNLGTT